MVAMADLTHVTYSLTHHCNLACSWCFQGASAQIPIEFDLDFRKRLLERVASKQRHLTLTGGEPFTYPHILPLMEFALAAFRSIGVTTNGVRFHPAHIDFVRQHRIPLAISLDGPEPVHDAVRGRGTYQRIKQNVQMLLGFGVPTSLQVTLSRGVAPHLETLMEEIAGWGVKAVSFQRLQPLGRGEHTSHECLSIPEALDVAHRIQKLAENYRGSIKLKTKDPLHRTLDDSLQARAKTHPGAVVGGCRAAISYLFIEVDGEVLPCPLLRLPVGNVMQQTLEDIWLRSPVLRRLRSRSHYTACSTCANWQVCRGCRAHALMDCGDVMGRDPQCWNTAPLYADVPCQPSEMLTQ